MSTAQFVAEESIAGKAYEDVNKNQYLTFILAGEEYGVDILRVQEIKGWENVTKIPNAPLYIKGVMNLRGAIVPIIDLRQRFNLEVREYGHMTVVIVLKVENDGRERTMGVVVDAVSDVYDIANEHMKPPPDFGDVINIEYLKGLATVDNKMVMILDIDHLLSSNEMALLNPTSVNRNSIKNSGVQDNISLVENTFLTLSPQGEHLVKRFYEELFSRHPDVKPLFAHLSMKEQETKLFAALKLVINNLRNPHVLNETLNRLGKRHAGYGANAELYKAVSAIFLDVLKEAAGTLWTEDVSNAWSDAFKSISNIMLRAAGN